MKTITAYWEPTCDFKYTNFGDILTPYILNYFDINTIYEKNKPDVYGIGSLLSNIPKDFEGHIWTTGFIYPTPHFLKIKNDPIAVRGIYTKNHFINDTSNTVIGDGGLILDRIYKPKTNKKYKLGIFPNYCDIINMRDNPIENFNVFKYNPEDIILIDPRNYIETVIEQAFSCENIITSSLHGAVVCDSYGINYGVFSSRETDLAIHNLQSSFKFNDYYSIFNICFNKPSLFLDNNTQIEKCLSICNQVNKPMLERIKNDLIMSIDKIKEI